MGDNLYVGRFTSAFHMVVEVNKVKKQFLRRVLEVTLQDKAEIPKPFAFGYRICEEKEDTYSVSVSVVAEEEVLQVLKEHPEAECVVTQEVAFASHIFRTAQGPCWGIVAGREYLSLFLCHKGCVVYSTSLPVMGEELGDADAESINAVFRFALGVVPQMPEKAMVTGDLAQQVAGLELMVPVEVVPEFSCEVQDVQDYNLIPPSVLEKRRVEAAKSKLALFMAVFLAISLVVDGWLFFKFSRLKSEIEENQKRVEEVYRLYSRLMELRERLKKVETSISKRNRMFLSFLLLKRVYDLELVKTSVSGVKLKSIVAKPDSIGVSGVAEDGSKTSSFLRYISFVSSLRSRGFRVVGQQFSPERGEFVLTLAGESFNGT